MEIAQQSKIWIFQSSRNFTAVEKKEIETKLNRFMGEWNAHGEALSATYMIKYDRFIILVVDENLVPASGCSIDSMTRIIKEIDEKYELDLLNRMLVSYKTDDEIFTLPLPKFKAKVRSGELHGSVTVFNHSLTSMHEFSDNWELPLKESWAKSFLD